MNSETDEVIDIELIMQEIREQIMAQQATLEPAGVMALNISGKRLPPDFYEHLYQAGLAYNKIDTRLQARRSRVPIIGPLLDRMRNMLHQLVIYYVNQVAAEQIVVNTHLLQALSILSEALEEEAESG